MVVEDRVSSFVASFAGPETGLGVQPVERMQALNAATRTRHSRLPNPVTAFSLAAPVHLFHDFAAIDMFSKELAHINRVDL